MADASGAALREERLGEVDELVTATPVPDATSTHRLAALRSRLRAAHGHCEAVDSMSWAGYVADLDRGIDELHVELEMVGQQPAPGPTLDDVLLARTTALELDAWHLAASADPHRPGGAPELRAALAATEATLARYREELATTGPVSRTELETAVAELRRAGSGRLSPAAPAG